MNSVSQLTWNGLLCEHRVVLRLGVDVLTSAQQGVGCDDSNFPSYGHYLRLSIVLAAVLISWSHLSNSTATHLHC